MKKWEILNILMGENSPTVQRLEIRATRKFFDKSDTEIVGYDIIQYCTAAKLKLSRRNRMIAALNAIDRCGDGLEFYIEDFNDFDELVEFYISK